MFVLYPDDHFASQKHRKDTAAVHGGGFVFFCFFRGRLSVAKQKAEETQTLQSASSTAFRALVEPV